MDCRAAEMRLDAWLDGELAAGASTELERHLAGCSACRRRRQELAAARDLFRRLAPRRSRLRAADVLARVAAEAAAAPPERRHRHAWRWVPVAAAVALAALGLWRSELRRAVAPAERQRPAAAGRSTPAAPLPRAAAVEPAGSGCGPQGGEGCDRLACFDAAQCGTGTAEAFAAGPPTRSSPW